MTKTKQNVIEKIKELKPQSLNDLVLYFNDTGNTKHADFLKKAIALHNTLLHYKNGNITIIEIAEFLDDYLNK